MRRKFCTFAADFIKTLNIMKPSYFILALLCAFSMAFVSCENNDPDTKKGGDDTTSQHQPANPATWSPAGHVYVYETTWENSPAADHYWAHVADFFSKDSVFFYQTHNRDIFSESDYTATSKASYTMNYPKVVCKFPNVYYYQFKDTLTFVESGHDYLIFK